MESSGLYQTCSLKDEHDVLFAGRMEAAGITPTTRIGIAVSGGPDSTALCILASRWTVQNGGSSSSLMGFTVDHGLRADSALEALIVQSRIASLGIGCEVLKCSWRFGMPTHGHVQEAARNARYELVHTACKRNNVDVLLTAHHLDDQIELFIIRLTRHSGLSGLAGMPFTSSLYRCVPKYAGEDVIHGLLLVRPLLDSSKHDLYELCKKYKQSWVEDPTNKKLFFLRNVVRSFLDKPEFCILKKELPPLIILCRNLRTFLDKGRNILLYEVVSIDEVRILRPSVRRSMMSYPNGVFDETLISRKHDLQVFGHVIIDLEKLKHAKPTKQALKRMLVAVLQFVAQKEKPPRGNVVETLVNHLNSNHLKGALTLAGCNICVYPGSKQSQIIICTSCDSKLPASAQPMNAVWALDPHSNSELCSFQSIQVEVSMPTFGIMDSVAGDSYARFMKVESPPQFLSEARHTGMLSDRAVMALSELMNKFSFKSTKMTEEKLVMEREKHSGRNGRESVMVEVPCEHVCYFMNRFCIAWGRSTHNPESEVRPCSMLPAEEHRLSSTGSSYVQAKRALCIRYMQEKDWIFLSQCAKQNRNTTNLQCLDGYKASSFCAMSRRNSLQHNEEDNMTNETQLTAGVLSCCFDYSPKRAQHAMAKLKRIPVPVRRGLPVFVTPQGALISIPSLGFSLCPNIWVFSRFCPKVPIGGGYASWL